MNMPDFLFSPVAWIVFWLTLGAFALWAVWAGSREWEKFEEMIALFDQDEEGTKT